jgi:hypothetical protein
MKLIALLAAGLLSVAVFAETQEITIQPGQSAEISTGNSHIVVTCKGDINAGKAIKCQCYFGFTHVGEVVGPVNSDFNQMCKDGTGFSSAQAQGCREI